LLTIDASVASPAGSPDSWAWVQTKVPRGNPWGTTKEWPPSPSLSGTSSLADISGWNVSTIRTHTSIDRSESQLAADQPMVAVTV
jgi:hypothetical protein